MKKEKPIEENPTIKLDLRSAEEIYVKYIQIRESIDDLLARGDGNLAVKLYPAKQMLEWVLKFIDFKEEKSKKKSSKK